jgi:hypothetical protein
MDASNASVLIVASFSILGIASHLGYFIHGEHHMNSVRLAVLLLITPLFFFAVISRIFIPDSTWDAFRLTTIIVSSYLVSLTTSILTYRVFFHPLKHFPGPLSAKLSKLTHVARLLKKSDNYLQADKLHRKYGDIVR